MKKLIFLFLLLPFLIGATIDTKDGVTVDTNTDFDGITNAGKCDGQTITSASAWYTGSWFATGWEQNSDTHNTGGAGSSVGDGVFEAAILGTGKSLTTGLNGTAIGLQFATPDADNDGASEYMDTISTTEAVFRTRVKLSSHNFNSNDDFCIFMWAGIAGPTNRLRIHFQYVDGAIVILGRIHDGTSTWYDIGSAITISVGTEYQVEVYYKADTEAAFKVYTAAGSQVGSTQSNTTAAQITNETFVRAGVGVNYASYGTWDGAITFVVDNYTIFEGSWVGPE